MSELESALASLCDRIAALAPEPGGHQTALPQLRVIRAVESTHRQPFVYDPCLCIVAQGAKVADLGGETFRYDTASYLVSALPLPLECSVLDASESRPFFAMMLAIDPASLGDVLAAMDRAGGAVAPEPRAASEDPPRGIFSAALHEGLVRAAIRLCEALADPVDREVLAPMAYREVLYTVLRGEHSNVLRAAAFRTSGSERIARLVHAMHERLAEPHDVASLAEEAAMSPSTLHREFRAMTNDSPLAYLKKIRLHRARSLMIVDGLGAAEAAYRVGYGSASQFSREFKRLFGSSPSEVVGT